MFLDDIVSRLVTAGVGVYGTNIFAGSKAIIPLGDGPYLTVTETGGVEPVRTHNAAARRRPSAQIAVRATTYPAANIMIEAAYAALDGKYNVTWNSKFYLSVTARQEPTDTGLDETGKRPKLVFNIDTERRNS